MTAFVNACALWWQPLENPHLIRQDDTSGECVGGDALGCKGEGAKAKAGEGMRNGIRGQALVCSRPPPNPPLRHLQVARRLVRRGDSEEKETQEEEEEEEEEEKRGERASGMIMWWRELFCGNRHYRRWTCCYHQPDGRMRGNGAGGDGEEGRGEHVPSRVHDPAAVRSEGGRTADACKSCRADGEEISFQVLDEQVSDEVRARRKHSVSH